MSVSFPVCCCDDEWSLFPLQVESPWTIRKLSGTLCWLEVSQLLHKEIKCAAVNDLLSHGYLFVYKTGSTYVIKRYWITSSVVSGHAYCLT